MSDYLHYDDVTEAREQAHELRESHLLIRASEDAEEFGGGVTLRLCTNSRTLHPGTIETLAENELGVEYLGQPEDLHEWLLLER
ncbi:hypothetical protein HCTV-16_gp21 [Haloarcula virus HCTV-16]|nr:hypothetical protein HCTV-16_gp21 [Haloarcula virus HCTV-16]